MDELLESFFDDLDEYAVMVWRCTCGANPKTAEYRIRKNCVITHLIGFLDCWWIEMYEHNIDLKYQPQENLTQGTVVSITITVDHA